MLYSKYLTTEDEVRTVPSPEYTNTWHPISHSEMLDAVDVGLKKAKLTVRDKQFGLAKNNEQMFCVYDLVLEKALADVPVDFSMALGLRNSINKTLSAGMVVGSRVFVCDNLSFSGDFSFSRKHNASIEEELPLLIDEALSSFISHFADNEIELFDLWKALELSSSEGTEQIVRLHEKGYLTAEAILRVRDLFLRPKEEQFKGQTVWSLFNAVTSYAKERRETNPFSASEESMRQFKFFKDEYPLSLAS